MAEEQHEELQALRERVADMLDELNSQTHAVAEWKAVKRELGTTSVDEIRRAVSTMRDLEREYGVTCAAVKDAVQAMHGFKSEYGMNVATVRATVGAWVGLRRRLREGLAPGGDLSGAGLAKTAAILGASLDASGDASGPSPSVLSAADTPSSPRTAELSDPEAAPSPPESGDRQRRPDCAAIEPDSGRASPPLGSPSPASTPAADRGRQAAGPGPSLHDAVGAWVSIRNYLRNVSDPEIHAAVCTLESMQLDVPRRPGAQAARRAFKEPDGAASSHASVGESTPVAMDLEPAHARQGDHDEGHSAETCWPTPFETEEMCGEGSSFGIATVQRVQLVSGRVVEDRAAAPLDAAARQSEQGEPAKHELGANELDGVDPAADAGRPRDGGSPPAAAPSVADDSSVAQLCRSDSDHAALLALWPPVLALKREMRADIDAMAALFEALAAAQRAFGGNGRSLAEVLAACCTLLVELGADVRDLTHSLLGFHKQLESRGNGNGNGGSGGSSSLLMSVVALHQLLQGTNLAAAQIVAAVNALNSLVLRGDWDPHTLSDSMAALASIQQGSDLDAAAIHDGLQSLEKLSRCGVGWPELRAALDDDGDLKGRVRDAERVVQRALEVLAPPDDVALEDWRRDRDALVQCVGAGFGFGGCEADVLLVRTEAFESWLRHREAFAAWRKTTRRASRASALDSDEHAPARWLLQQPADVVADEPPSEATVPVDNAAGRRRQTANSHPSPVTVSSSPASTGAGAQPRMSFGQCDIMQTQQSEASIDRLVPRQLCQQVRLQLQHEMENRIQLQRQLSAMEEEVRAARNAVHAAERSLSLPTAATAGALDGALERAAREGGEPLPLARAGATLQPGAQINGFEDDLAFIRQVAAGDIDAPSLNPYLEVFKLKQRFDEWCVGFKHRMQLTYVYVKQRQLTA